MQPELPTPQFTPEQAPVRYTQTGENAPTIPTLERGVDGNAERVEQVSEAAARASDAAATAPISVSVPTPVPAQDDASSTLLVDDENPLIADDVDLIEKEWVDKAKRIIIETKDDPHRREQEVSKLQADYLRKRYGKELGTAD